MTSRQSEEEIPMELEEESAGRTETGGSHSTASSNSGGSEAKPSLHPERVVEAVAGSIREGGKNPAALDDEETPNDNAELRKWLADEGLSEKAIQQLNDEGFNSFYAFACIQREDVDSMTLNKGEKALILYLVEEAKPKASARDFTPSSGKSSSTKSKKRKVHMGNVSMVCQNVSGIVNIVSQTEYVAPSMHSSSYYREVKTDILGNVGADASEKPSQPKKAKSEKSSQITDFRNWMKSVYVTDSTLKLLIEEGFNSFKKLILIEEVDVQDLQVNRGQIRLVTTAVRDLQIREKKKEFPFNDGDDDCDSVKMHNLHMSAANVTGEVNAVKQERIISDKPIQMQHFHGPVTTGILGNVAPGASVGDIHVGKTAGAEVEDTFPVQGTSPESPLSDRSLSELAGSVAAEWHALGIQLGVPAARLDQLRLDNPHSVHDQCFGALRLWRNSVSACGSDVENLRILTRCLGHPNVGRNDLANNLAEQLDLMH